MSRDPLARLPTAARLWLACVLCVLPLGLVWSASLGLQTLEVSPPGYCGYSGGFCRLGGNHIPGVYLPGHNLVGAQAPIRVFVIFAAVVLGYAAASRRTAFTKRLVRVATVAMAATVALAVPARAVPTVICQLGALALVAPLVWPERRLAPVFVPGRTGR